MGYHQGGIRGVLLYLFWGSRQGMVQHVRGQGSVWGRMDGTWESAKGGRAGGGGQVTVHLIEV